MLGPSNLSWNPDDWESFGMLLLRQRYGVSLVPIPDKSGGDGGLDAYTTDGTGWQCYAPENEPLTAKARYALQRDKITTDLKKLETQADRLRALLGNTVLAEWVLFTPKHESADLVAHCAVKSAEVVGKGLDFVAPTFRVFVQDLGDFAVESRLVQAARFLPDGLHNPSDLPDVDGAGAPFAEASGPLIDTMDGKLAKVVADASARALLRAEYLRSKIAGDDHLARFDDHLPDVGDKLRGTIARAKRNMVMEQATEAFGSKHLKSVQLDIEARIVQVVPELAGDAAETIAQGAITQWLQECSMTFDGELNPATADGAVTW